MSLRADILTKFKATPKHEQEKLVSAYQPADKAKERLKELARDFDLAERIRNESYEEFNNKSLMTVVNRDRRAFNNWVPPRSSNPDERWKANTIRPVTRNKVISIAAHITSSLLFPAVMAQNERDEEDRDAALVMKDLMLWANEQSDYAAKFVKAVIKALVDPAMIMYEGYAEVQRNVKEITSTGEWTPKMVLDEIYSGFQNILIPVEEFYIGNIYESSIQKQPFVIWRRVIDFSEAKAKYGANKLFQEFVQPGLKVFYSDDQQGFYEIYDEQLEHRLCEEVIYYNRFADLELRVINGVLIDDPDRPLQRADKRLPFTSIGYELLGGTDFFYFKSLVDKMSSDQEVIDTLYNMIIDGTFLQIMPPAIVMGDEEIDSSVIIPGAVTTLSEESKFQTINTNNNLNAGLAMLQKAESSLSESSTDPLRSGVSQSGTPATAFEVSRLEANAQTLLGLFGKMITQFVDAFGTLRVATILQHMTVADAVDIVGDSTRLRFRKFLIPKGQKEPGKTKKIEFDLNLPESEDEKMKKSFEIYEEEDKKGMTILKVNPEVFRRNKFLVKTHADFMPSQSEAVKKSLNLEAYDRMIQNPLLDQSLVTADFLVETYKPGESDKYLKKQNLSTSSEMMLIAPGTSNMSSQILNKAEAKTVA